MPGARGRAHGLPRNSSNKLKLSSATFSGDSLPTLSAMVAKTSARQMTPSCVLPGSTSRGQRTKNGTQWPASQILALVPRYT